MNTGQKIITLRKQQGLSQEALAEKSGLSLRTIQRLEQDESVPRLHTLKTLADSLGIPIAELNSPASQPSEPVTDQAIPPLRLINSSCLLVLLAPFLYLIVPVVFWFRHRQDPLVNAIGKRIISFQVLWLSSCFFVLLLTSIMYYQLTGARMVGKTSPLLISYLTILGLNTAVVLREAIRLQRGQFTLYTFVPSLF